MLKEWNINIVVTLVRHHKNTIPPSKKESDILMQRSQRKPTTTHSCSPQFRPASFWCFSKNSLTFSSTLSVHPSHGTNPQSYLAYAIESISTTWQLSQKRGGLSPRLTTEDQLHPERIQVILPPHGKCMHSSIQTPNLSYNPPHW